MEGFFSNPACRLRHRLRVNQRQRRPVQCGAQPGPATGAGPRGSGGGAERAGSDQHRDRRKGRHPLSFRNGADARRHDARDRHLPAVVAGTPSCRPAANAVWLHAGAWLFCQYQRPDGLLGAERMRASPRMFAECSDHTARFSRLCRNRAMATTPWNGRRSNSGPTARSR